MCGQVECGVVLDIYVCVCGLWISVRCVWGGAVYVGVECGVVPCV